MTDKWIQSGSVFEITDYTTASDWERFIASLEEILIEWKLNKQSDIDEPYQELPPGAISNAILHEDREIVKYGPLSFEVKYLHLELNTSRETSSQSNDKEDSKTGDEHTNVSEFQDARDGNDYDAGSPDSNTKFQQDGKESDEFDEHQLTHDLPENLLDIVSTNNDFAPKAHCLIRWFNLRRFILLILRGDTLVSSDKLKLLLSSASIALANVDCHVPIFIQHHNPKCNFYQGISEHRNVRTMFEMTYYKYPLKQYSYLSELISLFREKVGCTLNDPITVSVRLNYSINTFDLFPNKSIQHDELGSDVDELIKMTSRPKVTNQHSRPLVMDLKNDATFEQVVASMRYQPTPHNIIKCIHIGVLWPSISDKVIVDSQVHSDLDPAEAPIWTIRCITSDNSNMKIVHETQALFELFETAIDYVYNELDANTTLHGISKEDLKSKFLKLSFELSKEPEVLLSEQPGDCMRKLISLIFHRAAELTVADDDALEEIAIQLKKKPGLDEVYRNFNRKQKPSVKEFIIRTQVSRPFQPLSTPSLPHRMFCTVGNADFRLCGAFSELCN